MDFEVNGSSKYPMNISGNIIRRARLAAGLTQEQLSAKLQIDGVMLTRVQVSKIEIGYRYITDYEFASFIRVLGKDMLFDYLGLSGITLTEADFNRMLPRGNHRASSVAEESK